MTLFEAIKVLALRDVVKGEDSEYLLRKIFRWYSKTFHTPLHLVWEIPTEDVLRAYYEEQFEAMAEPDLEHEVRQASMSEEERAKAIAAEEAEEAEIFEMQQMMALEEQMEPPADAPPPISPLAPESLPLPPAQPGDTDLPAPEALPPNITMNFVSESEFEDILKDLDPFGEKESS